MSKFMIRLLRHDDSVHREHDGAVRFDDLADLFKSRFAGTSHWSIEAWFSFLAKGGGPKKRFQYCLNPNSSKHFLFSKQSRDIQEVLLLILHCFTEYIHHIGNAHDMHSIIQVGLIPGGRSLKRDRRVLHSRETDVRQSRSVYKNTWRIHPNTQNWCNSKLDQRKGLQFYQTRSHAVALFNTLLAIRIETVVYMKTGEDLYCKVFQSPRLPRVVLTPNLQHGRQDLSSPEARKTADHQSLNGSERRLSSKRNRKTTDSTVREITRTVTR